MYNTNEKVQAFLQTGISREVMVICQEDEEFYRLGWKEDNITKSERVHISNIAKMPLQKTCIKKENFHYWIIIDFLYFGIDDNFSQSNLI
jgi:hypothetical protein